jgi:hypothetical protein
MPLYIEEDSLTLTSHLRHASLLKDPGKQYQNETITENITLLDYFLDLIDKSLKHTKSIPLICIYMTADFPVLG